MRESVKLTLLLWNHWLGLVRQMDADREMLAVLLAHPPKGAGEIAHQVIPRAAKRALQTHDCRDKNVDLPGFDFLNRSPVQVHQLREFFLRDAARHPLPTHIGAENTQFWQFWTALRHALLGCK